MEFIEPTLKEVYDTLANNNELISILKDNDCLETLDNLTYNNGSVTSPLKEQMKTYNTEVLYDISKILIDNSSEIKDSSVPLLIRNKVAQSSLKTAMNMDGYDVSDEVYAQIYFTYKYCFISSFFQNNIRDFLPEVDYEKLEDNDAAKYFLNALMKEFDKFNKIISSTKDFRDPDEIPWDYINYFSHLLGIEKATFLVDDNKEGMFRELIKNIIDVYKIKGTNYAFETFFSLMGINIVIEEFYFDRRFYYLADGKTNSSTGYSSRKDFRTYMSTINPSYNLIVDDITKTEIVKSSNFTSQYNLNEFNELCDSYGAEAVLGYSKYDSSGKLYSGKVYKYFKTNYIRFTPSRDSSSAENFTIDEENAMSKYLDFLTPMYVYKEINIEIYQDNSEEGIKWQNGGTSNTTFAMLDSESWDSPKLDNNMMNYQDMIPSNYSEEFAKYLSDFYVSDSGNYYVLNTDKVGKSTKNSYESSIGEASIFRFPISKKKTIIINANKNIGLLKNHAYLTQSRIRDYILSVEDGEVRIYDIPPTNSKSIWNFIFNPDKETNFEGFFENSIKTEMRDLFTGKEYIPVKVVDYSLSTSSGLDTFINSEWYSKLTLDRASNMKFVITETISTYNSNSITSSNLNDAVSYYNSKYKFINYTNSNLQYEISKKDISNFGTLSYLSKTYEIEKMLSPGCFLIAKELSSNGNYTLYVYRYRYSINHYDVSQYIISPRFSEKDSSGNSVTNLAKNISYENAGTYGIAFNNFRNLNVTSGDEEITRLSSTYSYKLLSDKKYYSPAYIGGMSTAISNDPTCQANKGVINESEFENVKSAGKEIYCNYPTIINSLYVTYAYSKNFGIYKWYYTNVKLGQYLYSETDKKLYKIVAYGKYGLREVELIGNLILGTNGTGKIYNYDIDWNGPSEENDIEDFTFLNNQRKIDWSIYSSSEEKISRPVKYLTDDKYESDNDMPENILKEICKNTVEGFTKMQLEQYSDDIESF